MARVLESSDTKSFTGFSTAQTSRQADFCYYPSTDTTVIIPKDPSQAATAFPPETKEAHFERRLADARRADPSITIEPKRGGIHALYPEES